jgi:ribosomal protein S12 methylthiotransferase
MNDKFPTYYLESLGCAKNTVDSHSIASLLGLSGYQGITDPSQASVLIVNTCGFIEAARQESIETLQELAKNKSGEQILIAAGCLTEQYTQRMIDSVPGINGILGCRRWMDIINLIHTVRQGKTHPQLPYHLLGDQQPGDKVPTVTRAAKEGSSAYLKIADGCRRGCAFCAIPLIKGTTVSRTLDSLVRDARTLQEQGTQELILIAQDTTDYGVDLGIKNGLAKLLESLVKEIPDIPWIRIMYAFPGYVDDQLINVMASHQQILPYLDIPLQHAHPDVLKRMKRPSNMDWVHKTLTKMRKMMPGLALRTTFIVGYPDETEAEFNTLLDFIEDIQFDRAGAFTYSYEANTASAAIGDTIPAEIKAERLERLMLKQEAISLQINQRFIGQQLEVLIEGCDGDISIARSYRDAPEIDGLVIIEGCLPAGKILPVVISGAMAHDLTARPLSS